MKKEDGCLNTSTECDGELQQRFTEALGTEIWECAYHADKSREWREQLRKRYPDSSTPPPWFDPTIAGEVWDED